MWMFTHSAPFFPLCSMPARAISRPRPENTNHPLQFGGLHFPYRTLLNTIETGLKDLPAITIQDVTICNYNLTTLPFFSVE